MSSQEKDTMVDMIQDWFAENGYTGNGVVTGANGRVFIFTVKGKVYMPPALATAYKLLQ